ncbi:unnamed protein product [Ceratitis capitata]|uniref:(Mediterranean fruit fly) hypothetical protein n=1 Tax=Ceratitis capitata TaxID=7213 RepID=A0A811VIE3_CERCA|nr:unnamed protein product [Ceratitis capitata]
MLSLSYKAAHKRDHAPATPQYSVEPKNTTTHITETINANEEKESIGSASRDIWDRAAVVKPKIASSMTYAQRRWVPTWFAAHNRCGITFRCTLMASSIDAMSYTKLVVCVEVATATKSPRRKAVKHVCSASQHQTDAGVITNPSACNRKKIVAKVHTYV